MRKVLFFTLLVGLSAWMNSCQGIKEVSKKHSPAEVVSYEDGDQTIQVTYSRPYKKGRLIFGQKSTGALVPYGKKWRTGANEATEITFSQAVMIGGKSLAAGTYSLYSIPGPEHWIIAFNSRTGYWGATIPGTPFKKAKDVLRVSAPALSSAELVEQLSISFQKTEHASQTLLLIEWDQVVVKLFLDL